MHTILYKKSVEKDLRKLATAQRKVIIAKIEALATNPYPIHATKLRGSSDLFRIRHTGYRIIYQVEDSRLVIIVIKIGHRREVYRGF